jgi:hypothetical protein
VLLSFTIERGTPTLRTLSERTGTSTISLAKVLLPKRTGSLRQPFRHIRGGELVLRTLAQPSRRCSSYRPGGTGRVAGPGSIRIERRLAAIFAADVAGYSRLMEQDEVGTLRALTAHRELMDRLIGTMGAGLLTQRETVFLRPSPPPLMLSSAPSRCRTPWLT